MFSYANVSCMRNHRRYTTCAYHMNEGHRAADWRKCKKCANDHSVRLTLSILVTMLS